MLENWQFSSDLPMLVTDTAGNLRYWTPSAAALLPDLIDGQEGTPVHVLPGLGVLSNLNDRVLQISNEPDTQAKLIPLGRDGLATIMIPLQMSNGQTIVVFTLIEAKPGIVNGERSIEDIFQLLNKSRDTPVDQAPMLSEQKQLVIQAEKLAAIGQLAAGVAHEINNPMGYINSNLNTLTEYIQQLLVLIDNLEQGDHLADLKQQLLALDYAFIKTDIIDCLQESTEGAERVRNIIAALKDFSHPDDGRFNPCSLVEVFSTTLRLVENELKYKCTVHQDFADIGLVDCNASQIKQVVMNLIVNASHAIKTEGNIWLSMGAEGDYVWFSVEDDGSGIPDAIKARIFDPFFTTKPVGQGTGLGLSLSYTIVKRHGGRIELKDRLPGGTQFTVWLPRRPSPT